jgi:CheY-like chemotaxis protein
MNKLLTERRVLVVEDEMLVLMLAEDLLADLGCTAVIAAATAEQALELIATDDFDVAMLDMNLNGERTYAVADALAKSGVPFLFATGYAGRMGEGYGGRPILTKPYQPHQLESILADLLASEPVGPASNLQSAAERTRAATSAARQRDGQIAAREATFGAVASDHRGNRRRGWRANLPPRTSLHHNCVDITILEHNTYFRFSMALQRRDALSRDHDLELSIDSPKVFM